MPKKTMTLGLVSGPIARNWGKGEKSFGYEARRLLAAGRKIYGNAIAINPSLASVELPRGEHLPRIFHEGKLLPEIHSLAVRSTSRLRGLPAILRCLAAHGCDILDPKSRTGSKGGSKLTTSVTRFEKGVGSSTWLAFGLEAALDLAERLSNSDSFPLLGKPEKGHGGKGVTRIDDCEELVRYVKNLYSKNSATTLLLQPFESFENEFRVVTFFGKTIGIARKIPVEGKIAANAAQGGTFVPADRPDVVDYTEANASKVGILGVDVGETTDGELRIIEANRAPKWEEFDRALQIDTALEIVKLARKRLDERKRTTTSS